MATVALAAVALALAACGTAASGRQPATTSPGASRPAAGARSGAAPVKAKPSSVRTSPASGSAQATKWSSEGVACAAVPAGTAAGSPGGPAKSFSLTAQLGPVRATVAGIQLVHPELPYYQYRSTSLTVVDPAGTFHAWLGGAAPGGLEGLTPTDVGPGQQTSPLCLVRFAGQTLPTVVVGAGGPQMTLASSWAYELGVSIEAKGLSKPFTDLAATGGEPGLTGQRVVFESGHPLLLGQDGAFGYQGAATFQAPIVVGLSGNAFANVTADHPDLVASSVPALWTAWVQAAGTRPPAGGLAIEPLTSWAALECALGRQAVAYRKLATLQAGGWFSASTLGSMERELVRVGYCAASADGW